jgi:hypothetical protein
MERHEHPTFIDWWSLNITEYEALTTAEDGNPVPLANLIRETGRLATREAREFVADRLEGKKKKQGAKRTVAQQARELGILLVIRDIQKELQCGEPTAMAAFMDRYPNEARSINTLITYLRRAKATLKNAVGREPPPVILETPNSEHS